MEPNADPVGGWMDEWMTHTPGSSGSGRLSNFLYQFAMLCKYQTMVEFDLLTLGRCTSLLLLSFWHLPQNHSRRRNQFQRPCLLESVQIKRAYLVFLISLRHESEQGRFWIPVRFGFVVNVLAHTQWHNKALQLPTWVTNPKTRKLKWRGQVQDDIIFF